MTGSGTNMFCSVQYFGSRGVGVAAGAIDAQHGHDVAGVGRVDVLALVGVHPHNAAEPLLPAGALIEIRAALDEPALIDPHERQRAVRVFHHLERHRHGRLLRIGRQAGFLACWPSRLRANAFAWQSNGDGSSRTTASSSGCTPLLRYAEPNNTGVNSNCGHRRTGHAVDQLHRRLLLGQQNLHQFVAVHRERFEQLLPGGVGLVGHLGRNRLARTSSPLSPSK